MTSNAYSNSMLNIMIIKFCDYLYTTVGSWNNRKLFCNQVTYTMVYLHFNQAREEGFQWFLYLPLCFKFKI